MWRGAGTRARVRCGVLHGFRLAHPELIIRHCFDGLHVESTELGYSAVNKKRGAPAQGKELLIFSRNVAAGLL